jgi:phosphate transport system ATP-binding protein
MGVGIQVENLNAWYGKTQALYDVKLTVAANHATALIGPSGCGKSTFIRCLNRMHETIPEARVTGSVRIGEINAYNGTSATQLRRRVGMVFQKANPFPTMSIYDNVASGLKLNGFHDRGKLDDIVHRSLDSAALWDEVKDQGVDLSAERAVYDSDRHAQHAAGRARRRIYRILPAGTND